MTEVKEAKGMNRTRTNDDHKTTPSSNNDDSDDPTSDAASSRSTKILPPSTKPPKRKSPFPRLLIQGTVHIACIILYLVPILTPNEHAGPTLDEAHVMDGAVQKDIHDPNATLKQIFSNDYWGRPMNSPSSHRSWRPLTILSFRYLKGPYLDLSSHSLEQLTVHRVVNMLCHAATGELVGQLATQLFQLGDNPYLSEHESALWLQLIVKILFCLHPTHVEVTANAANRHFLFATLLGLVLCFPGAYSGKTNGSSNRQRPQRRLEITTPFWLFFLALISGYLVSESFLFLIPGVMVTMTVLAFTINERNKPSKETTKGFVRFVMDYLHTMISIAPRLVLLAASVFVYLGGRWYFDTLDIPKGLIRPAENPYYEFEGVKRVKNYLHVVTIHLGKQWGIILPKGYGGDPIGFSHEYGFDCIPEIQSWMDERLVFGFGLHILFAVVVSGILISYRPRQFFGLVCIHWSWTLFTLFPISGFVKVGTFVSDRIVVPATVVASIWIGKIVHSYATNWLWRKGSPFRSFRPLQFAFVTWWICTSCLKVQHRSLEWMDSISLMSSALVTCPRFAKVHMEVSKIYSGLFPSMLDLKKSRYHLDKAREIDPDFCDLHKQYALLGFQEGNYKEVENELTYAVLCPFTLSAAEAMFQKYWQQLLSNVPQGTPQHAEINERYRKNVAIIQQAIRKEKEQEEAQAAADGLRTPVR